LFRDEYSRVRVEEDEIEDIIDGSFQIKTPNISGLIFKLKPTPIRFKI